MQLSQLRIRAGMNGFTLVELVVVFLIVAVLAALALPQYQEYVRQGRRAEAATALLDGAQKLERYYSAHGKYLDDDGNLAPVFTTQIPATGTAYYVIASAAAADTSFTLKATAQDLMAGDKCGDFVINQAGTRTNENTGSGVTSDQCWRR